jgi:hypothetical protein
MIRQTVIVFGFVILGLATFVVTEHSLSPVFQQCIDKRERKNITDSAKNEPCSLGSVIGANVRCSGDFVDSHGSGITALATLMIAAFTWTLWIATTRQADFAREAHILDKRAFIFAVNFVQFWYPPDPATGLYNWFLRPIWRNTGDTSTKDLTLHVECEIRNTQMPPAYPFTYQDTDVATGIIGPKMDMLGGVAPPYPATLTPEDISEAQQGRRFIYLWGWVKYFDVFPDTPRHVTHFCWLITTAGDPRNFVPNTPGTPPTRGALSFGLAQHREGNYNKDEDT